MKKKLGSLMLGLVVCVAGLYASGWAPRDVQTVPGRVVGQWSVSQGSKGLFKTNASHLYFGPIQADGRGRFMQLSRDGGLAESGYWEVVQDVPSKNIVRVEIMLPSMSKVATLTVDESARSMEMGGPLGLVKAFSMTLTYVNAETDPSLVSVDEIKERAQMFQ